MDNHSLAIIDIDGCLTDYPKVFLDWARENNLGHFSDIEVMKASMTPARYESIKRSYRTCGVKRTLPIKVGARYVLSRLHESGYDLWVVTRRPKWEPVISDTRQWLENNGILFDRLVFVKDKGKYARRLSRRCISLVIDDERDILESMRGRKTLRIQLLRRRKKADGRIVTLGSWKGIGEYLERCGYYG